MAGFTFQKAVKTQEKLRLALDGPPGGGKTYTALLVAKYLAEKEGGRVAVIDSERSSARKYANLFDFDHLTLPDFDPQTYTGAIQSAAKEGYAVIVVDSLSHAWEGTLDLKDKVAKRSQSKDSFGAWREVTPIHSELVDTMLRAPAHVIATMRTKMDYDYEKDDNGKLQVRKLGLKPVQRDGVDYEFDVVGDLDQENTLVISKTRCPELRGSIIRQPGENFAEVLWNWLQDGEPVVTGDQVSKILDVFSGIDADQPQSDRRSRAKQMWKDAYGAPDALVASQFPEALTFAQELAGGAAQDRAKAEASEAPKTPGDPDSMPTEPNP